MARNVLREIVHRTRVVASYIQYTGCIDFWVCWLDYSTYLCSNGKQTGRTLGIYNSDG